ncbi:MAG: nucleotidyltransferase [Lachnospiraceae bacterium]
MAKTVGLITEYNPFHNGHCYHLQEARRMSSAEHVIVVMSGDFVQRGAPAILSKHVRTRMALSQGADLVLELPSCYATSSAADFAQGAVALLTNLGVVDTLCFGSESGELPVFQKLASYLTEEPEPYRLLLQSNLKLGQTFPVARQRALVQLFPEDALGEFLASPNNILGLAYCEALLRLKSPLQPLTLQRRHNAYHDTDLHPLTSSATAIRHTILQEKDGAFASLQSQMPVEVFALLQKTLRTNPAITTDHFSLLLKYKLMSEGGRLSEFADVSSDLAARIDRQLYNFETLSQFTELLKTRELTHSRISRALYHILLQLRQEDLAAYKQAGWSPYARVLGFRENTPVLAAIKKHSCVPLVTKLSTQLRLLPSAARHMLQADVWNSNLYESVLSTLAHRAFVHEYSQPVAISAPWRTPDAP